MPSTLTVVVVLLLATAERFIGALGHDGILIGAMLAIILVVGLCALMWFARD